MAAVKRRPARYSVTNSGSCGIRERTGWPIARATAAKPCDDFAVILSTLVQGRLPVVGSRQGLHGPCHHRQRKRAVRSHAPLHECALRTPVSSLAQSSCTAQAKTWTTCYMREGRTPVHQRMHAGESSDTQIRARVGLTVCRLAPEHLPAQWVQLSVLITEMFVAST